MSEVVQAKCPHCQNVKPEDVYRAAPVPAMRMPHRERL